jgi:hypothetical protein
MRRVEWRIRNFLHQETAMYFASVLLLLVVLPVVSIAVQDMHSGHALGMVFLIGRWMCFWAVGVRLFLAGVRQVAKPAFTAEAIFRLRDPGALPIVREVGFGNLAMGTMGLVSPARPEWMLPEAIVGGLYYGLAGVGHGFAKEKNAKEVFAMWTDLAMFVVLAAVVGKSLG